MIRSARPTFAEVPLADLSFPLRLAKDADPAKRAVALSLVWPGQRALKIASTRYSNAKDVPDTSRIEDPATALAVALAAAEHLDSNTPIH